MAVYGLDDCSSIYFTNDGSDEDEERIERLSDYLDTLKLPDSSDGSRPGLPGPYYGPGFFPKFARYLRDDWQRFFCFEAPFPDASHIEKALDDYGLTPEQIELLGDQLAMLESGQAPEVPALTLQDDDEDDDDG